MNMPINPNPNEPVKSASNTTLILIAIVMAFATMIITHFYVQRIKQQVDKKMITVYRVTRQLKRGDKFKVKEIEKHKIPVEFNESMNCITETTIANYFGRSLTRDVRQSEFVTPDMFTERGSANDLNISPGRRGLAIPIQSRYAPGVIAPGMIVDILGSFPEPGKQPKAMTVMQAVRIIAVGRATVDDTKRTTSYNAITIEVTPAEAQDLATVNKYIGRDGYDIVVRNPGDDQPDFVGVSAAVKRAVGLEK